jgi:hypothetical protein
MGFMSKQKGLSFCPVTLQGTFLAPEVSQDTSLDPGIYIIVSCPERRCPERRCPERMCPDGRKSSVSGPVGHRKACGP